MNVVLKCEQLVDTKLNIDHYLFGQVITIVQEPFHSLSISLQHSCVNQRYHNLHSSNSIVLL